MTAVAHRLLVAAAVVLSLAQAKTRCFLVQQHGRPAEQTLPSLVRVSLDERSLAAQSRLAVDSVVSAHYNGTLFPIAPGNTERTLAESFASVDWGGRFSILGMSAVATSLQLRQHAATDVLVQAVVSTDQNGVAESFGQRRANVVYGFRVSSVYLTENGALRFCVHQLSYSPLTGRQTTAAVATVSTLVDDTSNSISATTTYANGRDDQTRDEDNAGSSSLVQQPIRMTLAETGFRCRVLERVVVDCDVALVTLRLPTLQVLYSLVLMIEPPSSGHRRTTVVRVRTMLEEESFPVVSFELAAAGVWAGRQVQTLPLNEFTRDRNDLLETTELWCLYLYADGSTSEEAIVAAVWTVSHISLNALFVTTVSSRPVDDNDDGGDNDNDQHRFVTSLHYIRHTDSAFRTVEATLVDDRLFDGLRRTVISGFRRLGTDVLLVCPDRPSSSPSAPMTTAATTTPTKCSVCSTAETVSASAGDDRSLFVDCRGKLRSSLNVSSDYRYFDTVSFDTVSSVPGASSLDARRSTDEQQQQQQQQPQFGRLDYEPSLLSPVNVWHEVNCARLDELIVANFPSSASTADGGIGGRSNFVNNPSYVRGFFTFLCLWALSLVFAHLVTFLLVALADA